MEKDMLIKKLTELSNYLSIFCFKEALEKDRSLKEIENFKYRYFRILYLFGHVYDLRTLDEVYKLYLNEINQNQ